MECAENSIVRISIYLYEANLEIFRLYNHHHRGWTVIFLNIWVA